MIYLQFVGWYFLATVIWFSFICAFFKRSVSFMILAILPTIPFLLLGALVKFVGGLPEGFFIYLASKIPNNKELSDLENDQVSLIMETLSKFSKKE